MKGNVNILGFAASIDGNVHPVAVFKLTISHAYSWDWLHPSNGHTIVFEKDSLPINRAVPLSQGKVFSPVMEQHRSYHADGHQHVAIKASGRETEYVTRYKRMPIRDIQAWESFSSVDVPLVGPFFTTMDAAPWSDVKNPEVLRSSDFDSAHGVGLRAFLCSYNRIDDLITRWEKLSTRHWTAGNGPIRLVVLAERLTL